MVIFYAIFRSTMMWLLTFGGVLISLVRAEVPPCPPSEDVYPCSCSRDNFLTSIDCNGINNIKTVESILKNTKGSNMSYSFTNSRLGNIPSNFFEGQNSINIHFENCKIDSFGDKPFAGLENTLKNLNIYDSIDTRRHDLKTFPLSHLNKLENFYFQANELKRLGNDWFQEGPESLKVLMVETNAIEELGNKAFASLINLEQLWLGDSRFKYVLRSMFPRPAKELRVLDLSFCGIEELPEDIFDEMPALKTINMMGNKLQTIPETPWSKIWEQLSEVYIDRNTGFECDERLKWIYERKLPKVLRGYCTGENKLRGKKLNELSLEDFE